MKILHLALEAPYNESWGYQENLLTKYQVKLGHEVTLITTCMMNAADSQIVDCEPEDYLSLDGFRVIRLKPRRLISDRITSLILYYQVSDLLSEIKPDFIMNHGLGNFSSQQIIRYVKKINPQCVVIADNHLDYNIGASLLKKKFSTAVRRWLLRIHNKRMQKVYAKVYGVTPWRSEFARDIFGIKEEKLDVLPAGADDEKIRYEQKQNIRTAIREAHSILPDDFLIVTGGKIDERKNIDKLMQAVAEMNNDHVKLLVFGRCSDDIKNRVEELARHPNIVYIGWIPSEKTYDYFLAADLVFFPGQHSVMWEQACACGTPCVFKHYHAMHHCDIGGNCKFLYDDSVEGIQKLLGNILFPENYAEMLLVAESSRRKEFMYSYLAHKALEVLNNRNLNI